ncbi:MAG TPA: stage II sporulation protein M [Myxococcota bacterium]|nr:stage II sporulation protein M [Myxococcota bacterium]
MKLAAFEAQGRPRWQRLSELLDALEQGRGAADGVAVAELPGLYRHVCNDLALARERELSTGLVAELNELALRGHQLLYRARADDWPRIASFLTQVFPRAVRREWRLLLVCHVFFYSLTFGIGYLAWRNPDVIYSFIDEPQVRVMEDMYDPVEGAATKARGPQEDAAMFGYYIWNNISIAFRTFAGGLAFGVGSLVSLVFNALQLGLIAGHLVYKGSTVPFFTYVVAHSAFELTAMLLSGVAGMRLGLAIVAPGPRTRLVALRSAAQQSLPIVTGCTLMLVIAASIEAFWSPRLLPPPLKYGAGATLWLLVAAWLGLAGRVSGD